MMRVRLSGKVWRELMIVWRERESVGGYVWRGRSVSVYV